ncbi:hypothetical protein EJF18_40002 [Clavispora lusitaniae]|uniref:Uncharacterized protein n=1 Tax=Clavispora lusitaniae TaxID=36911 RepID=A0ACD0WLP4_CLALS|nr:hypothetical protein EJF14_40002 [Clavispora lusitaniae]QFZ33646.1 hypothetical protein EJF16_40002 [Clavispora lusitaniae]QFZ39317.1 hypothetical protein EJF15_40002 [Clavispora lusitaniae]QFZ44999.1 hypothetical protein EJF18_40002 [Clavispora lusitaniae]QFZ50676.1 hypothetical protein EJF17_40002 [Clavispora lusitaniae]
MYKTGKLFTSINLDRLTSNTHALHLDEFLCGHCRSSEYTLKLRTNVEKRICNSLYHYFAFLSYDLCSSSLRIHDSMNANFDFLNREMAFLEGELHFSDGQNSLPRRQFWFSVERDSIDVHAFSFGIDCTSGGIMASKELKAAYGCFGRM